MKIGKIGKIFIFILPLAIIFFLFYFKSLKRNEIVQTNTEITIEKETKEELKYNSNIIENVKYTSSDADGNRYTITALQGEIDYTNPNILYLTKVNGLIELKDSDDI